MSCLGLACLWSGSQIKFPLNTSALLAISYIHYIHIQSNNKTSTKDEIAITASMQARKVSKLLECEQNISFQRNLSSEPFVNMQTASIRVCPVCACMRACECAGTYVHVCMCVCVFVHVLCVNVCMCVCVCLCVCV